jgi:hypothetical protein
VMTPSPRPEERTGCLRGTAEQRETPTSRTRRRAVAPDQPRRPGRIVLTARRSPAALRLDRTRHRRSSKRSFAPFLPDGPVRAKTRACPRSLLHLHFLPCSHSWVSTGASIVVDAGPWDRTESGQLRARGSRRALELRAEDGSTCALQPARTGLVRGIEPPRNTSGVMHSNGRSAAHFAALRCRAHGRPGRAEVRWPARVHLPRRTRRLPRPDTPKPTGVVATFTRDYPPAGLSPTTTPNHIHQHGLCGPDADRARRSCAGLLNMGELKGGPTSRPSNRSSPARCLAAASRQVYTDLPRPAAPAGLRKPGPSGCWRWAEDRFRAFDLASSQRATGAALLRRSITTAGLPSGAAGSGTAPTCFTSTPTDHRPPRRQRNPPPLVLDGRTGGGWHDRRPGHPRAPG